MSSEPRASNVGGVNEAWLRRPSRGGVALIAVATVVGVVVGGWLDYTSLSDNEGFRALAVRFVAVVVALLAGAVWSGRHGQRARVVALASATFVVASLTGGWIAPSAHPAGWSSGSARVELRGGLSRTDTIAVDCSSDLGGALLSISNVMATRAPGFASEGLGIGLTIQAESPLAGGAVPASTGFSLQVWTGEPGGGPWFDSEPGITAISAEGTPQRGRLAFEKLSRTLNGYVGPPNDLPTLAGAIDWTCQPATTEPTPIEGSWFH